LAYATLNSDSGAPVNTVEYIVGGAGLSFAGDHVYKVELTAESAATAGSDASASNQILQLNAANNSNLALSTRLDSSNLAICGRLDKQTYTNSNLHVRDDYLASQLINLSTNLGNGTYSLLETDPVISGGVRVKGSVDGNVYVYDAQVKGELITLNGTFDDLISGDSQLYVALSGDDSVSVMGYNATTMMPEAVTLTESSGIRALDVHVANQPSGYATESTLSGINDLVANQSAYNRFQVEAPVSDGKLDTIITNMSLTNFNVSNLTKCDTDNVAIPAGVAITGSVFVDGLSTCNTNDVYISNYPTSQSVSLGGETVSVSGTFWQETQPVSGTFWQETQPVSGTVGISGTVPVSGTFWQETQPVSISGTVPISSGSPLDTHLYAEHNSTWQSVKAASNGHLLVNSTLETDANGSLTSTVNDDINALDVQVQNIVSANLRTSVGGLLTSTSGGTTNSLDVAIKAGSELKTTDYGALTSTLSGTGNSVHSLDVAVKNNIAVENVSNSQLAVKAQQYGSYGNLANNVASILPSGVTSGINVSDWSYFVGAYEDFNGATVGTISLEYSFDNITYYTLFNTQIFPSGSGTPRRANINKQDIPAVNWIRLRNGTSSTLTSVTVTLLGGSLS
jgi:hypothetical protein